MFLILHCNHEQSCLFKSLHSYSFPSETPSLCAYLLKEKKKRTFQLFAWLHSKQTIKINNIEEW